MFKYSPFALNSLLEVSEQKFFLLFLFYFFLPCFFVCCKNWKLLFNDKKLIKNVYDPSQGIVFISMFNYFNGLALTVTRQDSYIYR